MFLCPRDVGDRIFRLPTCRAVLWVRFVADKSAGVNSALITLLYVTKSSAPSLARRHLNEWSTLTCDWPTISVTLTTKRRRSTGWRWPATGTETHTIRTHQLKSAGFMSLYTWSGNDENFHHLQNHITYTLYYNKLWVGGRHNMPPPLSLWAPKRLAPPSPLHLHTTTAT